ncbi:hypothetical protein Hdeb2414_s0089g00786761 [Helianthus debilis subsp. tardiflorus]
MGFRRKRKKLKEFSGDMKFSNHDVFLSFKDKIRSGCENRQNYSVGIKCFPILRSRICIWVWAH